MMKAFDIAKHLKTDDDIREFYKKQLIQVMPVIFTQVGIAARAKGMTNISGDLGVSRSSLYKSLSEDGKPAFETIFNVVKSFGLTLAVH
ncbi:MAG: putative addiction module antidote protein [Moraxellaceae bacterium]|nr:putative addiction module antidote protein [Moraxellaceae bacterium]